jgi:hypothetical protein
MDEIKSALKLLSVGLEQVDLTPELEELEQAKAEKEKINEGDRRVRAEIAEYDAKLTKLLRDGMNPDAAAEAYLAGTPDEELETEAALKDKLATLRAVLKGIVERQRSAFSRVTAAEATLEQKLASAGEAATASLRETTLGLLQQLEEVFVASKVVSAATAKRTRLPSALEDMIRAGAAEGLAVERTRETPLMLIKALEPHAAKIRQGRGSILQHIIPPRTVYEQEPAPEAEPYVPGIGGAMGMAEGPYRLTHL